MFLNVLKKKKKNVTRTELFMNKMCNVYNNVIALTRMYVYLRVSFIILYAYVYTASNL